MNKKQSILFLCTENSCRSQMAEALLKKLDITNKYNVFSAGLNPAKQVHPLAVKVMEEIGIDISMKTPVSVSDFLGKQVFKYVITVCSKAQKECPRVWPGGTPEFVSWPHIDPANSDLTEIETLELFRTVRDEIKQEIESFLNNN